MQIQDDGYAGCFVGAPVADGVAPTIEAEVKVEQGMGVVLVSPRSVSVSSFPLSLYWFIYNSFDWWSLFESVDPTKMGTLDVCISIPLDQARGICTASSMPST